MLLLPIDIQVLIISFLTSASLVALAQSNRHSRRLIDPQREQFVNRLLELECLPEHGGEATVNEHAKIIVPQETVSYVCANCLKILHHTHFDNHALLRLRFRKPPPESRASQNLCGWVGGDTKARALKRQADLRNDTLGDWTSQNSSSGLSNSKLIDLYKIGSKRNRRLCNECKFIPGFWSRNAGVRSQTWRGKNRNSNIGTATVPVVKGRQRRFHDSTERYFWGLIPRAPDADYPFRWEIYREENCDWWTLWHILCPGCTAWRERAGFRKGGGYGVKATLADPDVWRQDGWDGPHFEEWRCNKCLEKSSGVEELSRQLLKFWKRIVEYEISLFNRLLVGGWFPFIGIEQVSNNQHSWEQIVRSDLPQDNYQPRYLLLKK